MADLFCKSITRYPKEEDISVSDYLLIHILCNKHPYNLQRILTYYICREQYELYFPGKMLNRSVLIATMKGCKEMLLTFRTEERRKVSEIAAS
jgi:hypothetical protein